MINIGILACIFYIFGFMPVICSCFTHSLAYSSLEIMPRGRKRNPEVAPSQVAGDDVVSLLYSLHI